MPDLPRAALRLFNRGSVVERLRRTSKQTLGGAYQVLSDKPRLLLFPSSCKVPACRRAKSHLRIALFSDTMLIVQFRKERGG